MDYREIIARAADAHGVEPEYIDIWGRTHTTPEDVTSAILHSLGFPAGTAEEAERALDQHRAAEWSQPLDQALVVREGEEWIRLRVPADRAGSSVKLEIRWERHGEEHPDLEHHWYWLPELQTLESASAGGREFLAKRLPLPGSLRLGYHDVRLYWVTEPELELFGQARLIVCPKKAYAFEQRAAGVAVSLYGLRSERNWGCGDFTDLRAAIDAFAPAGAAFLALNPLHAIANRQPYNTSPYLPQCAFYRNFIYLDVEHVATFDIADSLRETIDALRKTEFVEYERVAQLKLATLKSLFEIFIEQGGSSEFDRYIDTQGALLHDFAVYCALDEKMHQRDPNVWLWTQWPAEYRDPRSPAVDEFAREHRNEVLFYKFVQWHIDRQLEETQAYARKKGMSIGLYHDLALATDRFGADLWMQRPFYVPGCRVGSPPDDFSPGGQDWAFPPPNRDIHRNSGYEVFAQSIRKNAQHGGALRIDHVMRFFRLYWIPEGMGADRGAYVRDYSQDLMSILALESVRGKFVVVGEDLGTATGEMRQSLAEAGILGYRLLWFERQDGRFRHPHEYAAQTACSTTTHDLPTLAGFAAGRDIEARRAAGLIDEENYHRQRAARDEEARHLHQALAEAGFPDDPIGFLLSTPCALAIVNQEDLSGETEQQNLPGSTWQYPNWRRKMKVTVEQLGPLADKFAAAVKNSHRAEE